MTQRNFSNTSTIGTLSAPLASSATSISVNAFSNAPTAPFTVTIDRNTATEEVCLVTAVSGATLTLTRGYDGTAGQAHTAGATIEHTAGAIEYTEANLHTNATSNVHGVTGPLVGNQGTQTIYDKTLVSPVVQADVTKGDAVVAVIPVGATVRNLFRGVGADGANKFTVDSSGNLTVGTVTATGKTVGRNWGTYATATLPVAADGVQVGDVCFSTILKCELMWVNLGAPGSSWRQATLSYVNTASGGIAAFSSALVAAGMVAHEGFQVHDQSLERLYMSTGSTAFVLVGGKPASRDTTAWTPSGNWTVANQFLKSLGNGMAMLYGEFTRTTSSLAVFANGNFANEVCGTLPTAWAPVDSSFLTSGVSGRTANYSLATSGAISIVACAPGSDIAIGEVVSIGGIYPLADPTAV